MKPKSISRFHGLRQTSALALVSVIATFAAASAHAATYQWNGSQSSSWLVTANWNGLTAPAVPDYSGTFNHRLNVNGATALEYNFPSPANPTVYANTSNSGPNFRGLVIGSVSSGRMNITGGTFSSAGSPLADVVGNGNSPSAVLDINGGNYISGVSGLALGLGGVNPQPAIPPSSTLDIANGTATVTSLAMNNNIVTINLNPGGVLEANSLNYQGWAATLNFDGGTLKARTNNPAFVPDGANLTAYVKAGGATIDTNSFNVTISETLLQDPLSTGGDLTKNGAGTLTLANPSTIAGDVTISTGGLGVKTGPASWTPASFIHSGDKLNFDLGIFNMANPPAINVTGDLALNNDIEVNISGFSIPITSEIIILAYSTKSGTGTLTLNTSSLPTNMVATLEENTGQGYYYLNVTSPSASAFNWSAGTGDWDSATANWNSGTGIYAEPAAVTFPNLTGGGTVTIAQNVAPVSISISNAATNNYTFAGSGLISGSTGIIKTGTGIASFNGAAHSYSGAVAINAGAFIKQAADATTGTITVAADNVSFVLDGGITDGAGQTLVISGRGALAADYFYTGSAVQRGALQAHNGANTWAGDVVLASNVSSAINRIGVQNGASLTLTGTISENLPLAPLLFRAGAVGDDIILGGTGTYSYTGQTQIFSTGASIILGGHHKLPTVSSVFFGSNGSTVFDLNGFNQEFAGISGNAFGAAATITNNGSSPSTLATTSPAESPTETTDYYPGLIADGNSVLSFVKNGEGTQVLAGANSYSGTTTINGGRLEIQENQSATGDVTINGGNLKLSNGRSLSPGVNMSIASGAFFFLDGSSQTLGKLEGGGTIDHTYNVAGVDTLTVGAGDQSSTFDGVIQQSQPRTYALTKTGLGTFTLTGLNTYTGNTTVEDGTLSVAQSNFADTSTVTIGTEEASEAILHLPNTGTDIVAALIIDGVSQPGNGLIYDSANTNGAITGNGKIQVGTAPGGYAQWALENNVVGGETGDDDKDGITNLVEYALGLDPQVGDPSPGTFDGKLLTFTKGPEAKAANDLTYVIETSTTLAEDSWIPAAANDTTDTISYSLPTGVEGGRIFGRLKVVK
jgi:autotransporter-associated beta strand protein